MELPYHGRAVINEYYNSVEIAIPARRNWFIVVFLSFWLCGWAVAEFFTAGQLLSVSKAGGAGFLLLWICAWTVGGFFAIRTWWWNVAGKEIINAGQGVLTIERKGALFVKTKTYDLHEAKNFRAQEESSGFGQFAKRNRNNVWKLDNIGTIRFDYGMRTVKFGAALDEAEAFYILQKLRDKKIIA